MADEIIIYDRKWTQDSIEFRSLAEQLGFSLNYEIQDMLLEADTLNCFQTSYAKMEFVPVGSSQDGSTITTPDDAGDVDILLIPLDVLLSQSLFEYDQDYPAFLHVRGDGEHSKYFEHCDLVESKWVPVTALKEYTEKVMPFSQSFVTTQQSNVNFFHESAVGIEFSIVDDNKAMAEQSLTPEKISCMISDTNNEIKNINSPKIIKYDKQENLLGIKTGERNINFQKKLSADLVPAFSFSGWPYSAMEWISRKRFWPPDDVVAIVQTTGCQIVSKRPMLPHLEGDTENEDRSPEANAKDTYFRLSFARCEVVMSKSLPEPTKLCWRVLKAFQKKYLHTKPRVLSSYHWKNIVFWISEETVPVFWTENNVLGGVIKGIDFMLKCLEKRFVPLYFVPNENLISGCREDKITETFSRLHKIRSSPLEHLRWFLTDPPGLEPYVIMEKTIKQHNADPYVDLTRPEYVYNPSNMDDLKHALMVLPQIKEELIELMEDLESDRNSENEDENEIGDKSDNNSDTSNENRFADNVNLLHFMHEYMRALSRLQTKPCTETIQSVERSVAGRLAISTLSEQWNTTDHLKLLEKLLERKGTANLQVTEAIPDSDSDMTEQTEETPQIISIKNAYAESLRSIINVLKGNIVTSDIDGNNPLACSAETKRTLRRIFLQKINQENKTRAARKLDTDIPLD